MVRIRLSMITYGLLATAGMVVAGTPTMAKKQSATGPAVQMSESFRASAYAADAAIKAGDAASAA